jgi:hypothetical protein
VHNPLFGAKGPRKPQPHEPIRYMSPQKRREEELQQLAYRQQKLHKLHLQRQVLKEEHDRRQQVQLQKQRDQQLMMEHLHQQYQEQQQQQLLLRAPSPAAQDPPRRRQERPSTAGTSTNTGTSVMRHSSSTRSRSPSPSRSSLLMSSDWTRASRENMSIGSTHKIGSNLSYAPSLASSAPLHHPSSSSFIPPPPPAKTVSRVEAGESKLRVPRHSISRVRLLCGWLTSLRLWHKPLEIENIPLELRSGVFLVRLVQFLDPSAVFVGVTQRVLNAKPAIANIEQVLGHVLRSKKISTNRCVNLTLAEMSVCPVVYVSLCPAD